MPYVDKETREELAGLAFDSGELVNTPGELNYVITKIIIEYVGTKGLSYQTINDIIGALEGAKLEFYRRVAAGYENTKINTNGDVY